MRSKAIKVLAVVGLVSAWSQVAQAQDSDFDRLMAMDVGSLRGEIQTRYQAGLQASLNHDIVAANDSRYLWALEAKVQCAIAMGYLKSSIKDETSIRKCDNAYHLINYVAPPAPPPPPPPTPPAPPPVQKPDICNDKVVGIVFFDFDSADITPEGSQTIDAVVANKDACGWHSFSVVGNTDQAGSDAYNMGLSQRRADVVAQAMEAKGIDAGTITVTADGERNPRVVLPDGTRSPQNRRTEISAN